MTQFDRFYWQFLCGSIAYTTNGGVLENVAILSISNFIYGIVGSVRGAPMVLEGTYSHHIDGQGKFIKYDRVGGYFLFGMSSNHFKICQK